MNKSEGRRQRNKSEDTPEIAKPEEQQTQTIQQAIGLGLRHHAAGRLSEAEDVYRKILQIDPHQPVALHLLGVSALQGEKYDLAVQLLMKAVSIKPDFAEAHGNLGYAFQKLGKLDNAVDSHRRALAIQPDNAEEHGDLGVALHDLGELSEAVASYREALAIQPDYATAHYNLGKVLHDLGKPDEAVASYRQALAIQPDYVEARNNLGNALHDLGKLDDALASYRQALAIQPDNAEVHKTLGLLQLLMGDFQNGWKNYAWRWREKDFSRRQRDYKEPVWDGRDLQGETIFIYQEQGLGDVIQFARYLPLVAARGGRVVFEAPEALLRLFQGNGLVDNIFGPGESPPPFDCHAPLLDLPRILNTTLETIPSYDCYLKTAPKLREKWADRLGPRKEFRLGIAWAGSPGNKNDRNRSIDASLFRPLTEIPGLSLYSLQVGRNGEAEKFLGGKAIDIALFLTDFAETAAAMDNLDLIVSADTSVVHLAGALGRPVWTLLPLWPDWRWLLERDDSPWYPAMRLFRQQTHGDWKEVLVRVSKALVNQRVGQNLTP